MNDIYITNEKIVLTKEMLTELYKSHTTEELRMIFGYKTNWGVYKMLKSLGIERNAKKRGRPRKDQSNV